MITNVRDYSIFNSSERVHEHAKQLWKGAIEKARIIGGGFYELSRANIEGKMMHESYWNERWSYPSQEELKKFKVIFDANKAIQKGSPLKGSKTDALMFTINPDNCCYSMAQNIVADSVEDKRNHSYLARGGYVAAAGEFYTDEEGYLRTITNQSGHYLPERVQILNSLRFLKNSGVDLSKVRLQERLPNTPRLVSFYSCEEYLKSDGFCLPDESLVWLCYHAASEQEFTLSFVPVLDKTGIVSIQQRIYVEDSFGNKRIYFPEKETDESLKTYLEEKTNDSLKENQTLCTTLLSQKGYKEIIFNSIKIKMGS